MTRNRKKGGHRNQPENKNSVQHPRVLQAKTFYHLELGEAILKTLKSIESLRNVCNHSTPLLLQQVSNLQHSTHAFYHKVVGQLEQQTFVKTTVVQQGSISASSKRSKPWINKKSLKSGYFF